MPGFIKTEKDEKVWSRAKARVKEQYPDLSEDDDSFWALTNKIYHSMRKKTNGETSMNKGLGLYTPMRKEAGWAETAAWLREAGPKAGNWLADKTLALREYAAQNPEQVKALLGGGGALTAGLLAKGLGLGWKGWLPAAILGGLGSYYLGGKATDKATDEITTGLNNQYEDDKELVRQENEKIDKAQDSATAANIAEQEKHRQQMQAMDAQKQLERIRDNMMPRYRGPGYYFPTR